MSQTIKIEKGFLRGPRGNVPATTLTLINHVLDYGGEKGISIKEILDRTRIDRAIESLEPDATELKLSDKLFDVLKKATSQVIWAARSPLIVSYILNFETIEEADVIPIGQDIAVQS
jgi:hypothetical protein